jgi:multidrug efflux system membrane fusion protein
MNRSVLIAMGIFLVLCLYMLTGLVGCTQTEEAEAGKGPAAKPLMTVQVREMQSIEIPREVTLSGKTAPSRFVDLKAETAGKVEAIADRRGMPVSEGDLIARIEENDRRERLQQAQATLRQAELEHEAALRLKDQGLRSDSQVAEALSRLRGAEQMVRAMEIDVRNTRLTAPFDGLLQERHVEVGDYLGIGDPVARIIDLDPLIIEGQATEFEVEFLEIGEIGHARLADGHSVDGRLRYVAGEADAQSRTFRIELEVPNPDLEIPAGITAQIAVETERVPAYRISPALISISDEGQFGVKTVDDQNRVRFTPADIVKSEPDALWLTGLPESIRLITVGQGFTQPGDEVKTELETTAWQ